MRHFWLRVFSFVAFIIFGISVASCSQYDVVPDDLLLADTGQPRKEVKLNEDGPIERVELKAAYFDVDVAVLKPEAKEAIRYNADWLKAHPDAEMQIEGYCDERGSVTHNLSLGEQRAQAAKDYLVELGIEPARITVLSYGASQGGQKTWANNRKDLFFVIYAK